MENLLRVELDIYALLLVAVMMISLSRRPLREGPPLERYFFLIAGSIAFILVLDAISGLYNQAAFMEMLQNWAANSLNSGNSGNSGNSDNFGAILFDIDNFKRINFDSGYEKGNEVLLATGYAIKSVLGPRDIAARVGADEFIVLSPAGAPALEDLESQILAQVREIVIAGIDQEFTVSSAHAVFDQSAHPSIDSFLQTLDSLLYKKKESLKNVPLQPELPLS